MEGEDSQGKAALPVAPMEIADSELPPLTPEDTSVAPEKPSETKETARTTMDTESDLPPLTEDPTEQIPTEKQALPTSSEPEPEKTTEPSSDNTENSTYQHDPLQILTTCKRLAKRIGRRRAEDLQLRRKGSHSQTTNLRYSYKMKLLVLSWT